MKDVYNFSDILENSLPPNVILEDEINNLLLFCLL